ncbi:MAG: hypothetical protein K0U54_13255 [Bacteroidetes bacterium]|nr:hypothetical protein [Bacteroidota bacterium]
MKKVLLIMAMVGILTSCSEDDSKDSSSEQIIEHTFTIDGTTSYTYVLGAFGVEEGASIQVEPEHFQTSELDRDFNSGIINYLYEPNPNYVGLDYVELIATRGSDGASTGEDITIVKITFNITE